jgi:hypothetical protein
MLFAALIATIRDRAQKRARYERLVREIEQMTPRDLADIRASRTDMLRGVYQQVYGTPQPQ